ncbi:MAG: CARDB domain-containing protein, partial [Minisyncoccia bacterium]
TSSGDTGGSPSGGGAVNGACAATHYNCSSGVSTNGVSGTSSYTWKCAGLNGGNTVSCLENKTTSSTLPDLTASAPTPSTATINVAQTYTSTISNIGTTSTGVAFHNFFQVASSANGGGTITDLAYTSVSPSTMSALPASGSGNISQSYAFTLAGTYSIRACADKKSSGDTGFVTESNENNNCSPWTNITVGSSGGLPPGGGGGGGSGPDLTAGMASPSVATVGVSQTYSAVISNIGNLSTGGSFHNFFQVATDANGGGTITGLPASSMLGLGSGESDTAKQTYTFITAGTHSIRVCADKSSSGDAGVITESNEDNNCGAWDNVSTGFSRVIVPVVTITASPAFGTVNVINPTITWGATNNPTSCTASGDWSGSKAVPGSLEQEGILTTARTYTYTLTCVNANGTSAPASATVTVTNTSAVVNIDANPLTIYTGDTTLLTWSSNASSCAGTNFNANGKASGTATVAPNSNTTYSVTCDGVTASVTVTVKKKPIFIEN